MHAMKYYFIISLWCLFAGLGNVLDAWTDNYSVVAQPKGLRFLAKSPEGDLFIKEGLKLIVRKIDGSEHIFDESLVSALPKKTALLIESIRSMTGGRILFLQQESPKSDCLLQVYNYNDSLLNTYKLPKIKVFDSESCPFSSVISIGAALSDTGWIGFIYHRSTQAKGLVFISPTGEQVSFQYPVRTNNGFTLCAAKLTSFNELVCSIDHTLWLISNTGSAQKLSSEELEVKSVGTGDEILASPVRNPDSDTSIPILVARTGESRPITYQSPTYLEKDYVVPLGLTSDGKLLGYGNNLFTQQSDTLLIDHDGKVEDITCELDQTYTNLEPLGIDANVDIQGNFLGILSSEDSKKQNVVVANRDLSKTAVNRCLTLNLELAQDCAAYFNNAFRQEKMFPNRKDKLCGFTFSALNSAGQPIEGVTIEIRSNSKRLLRRGATDANGLYKGVIRLTGKLVHYGKTTAFSALPSTDYRGGKLELQSCGYDADGPWC